MTHLIVPWLLFVTLVAFVAWWLLKPNPNRARQTDPKVILAQVSVVLVAAGMLYWQSAFKGSSMQGGVVPANAIEVASTVVEGAPLISTSPNRSLVTIDSSGNPSDSEYFMLGVSNSLRRYVLVFEPLENLSAQNVAKRTLVLPFATWDGAVDILFGAAGPDILDARIRVHRLVGNNVEFLPETTSWNHRDKESQTLWDGGPGAERVSRRYVDSQPIGDIINGFSDDHTLSTILQKIGSGQITAYDAPPIKIDITALGPRRANQEVALRLSLVDADGYEIDLTSRSSKFIVLGSAYNSDQAFRPSLSNKLY